MDKRSKILKNYRKYNNVITNVISKIFVNKNSVQ